MYLNFSDSVKYAELAKNISLGLGQIIHHSFYNSNLLGQISFPANFPPLTPYLLSFIFKLFPATDQTVIWSGYFIFAVLILGIFFLGRKLHSTLVGLVSAIFLGLNTNLLNYAHNFSTELIFSGLLIVFLFFYLNRGLLKILSLIPLVLMFLTRQQTILFAMAVVLTEILHSPYRKKYIAVTSVLIIGLLLFGKYLPVSSVSPASVVGSVHISTQVSQGSYLRGQDYQVITNRQLATKIFYNLYNFTKNPDRIAPLIFLVLSIFALLKSSQNYLLRRIYTLNILSLSLFLFAASATLPNARYIHPLLPLLIITASVGLIEISKSLKSFSNLFISFTLILLVLPAVGFLTLDARFRASQNNLDKPPAYKVIADFMADNLPQNELIVTNLDAWAAWYHGLSTMWFPLNPQMLNSLPPKYIVITNYLEHDADFALGEWREVVYSPDQIQNQFLKDNYQVYEKFIIESDQVYEKQSYQGTILIRNQ